MQQHITEAEVEAARIRVTPHELAQAMAIVEARQEAEAKHQEAKAKHLADTIALGEAVQLGLAVTPEELLSEVQSLRAQAQQEGTTLAVERAHTTTDATAKKFVLVVAGSLGLALVFCAAVVRSYHWPRAGLSRMFTLASASTTIDVPNTSDIDTLISSNPTPRTGFTMFHTLDVQDGCWTSCDTNAIVSLARGAAPSQLVSTTWIFPPHWRLMRYSGKFLVEGWVTFAEAEQIARKKPAPNEGYLISGDRQGDPYLREEEGRDATTPILLPLEEFAHPHETMVNRDGIPCVRIR